MQAAVELFLQLAVNGFPLLTPFFLSLPVLGLCEFLTVANVSDPSRNHQKSAGRLRHSRFFLRTGQGKPDGRCSV